MPVHALKARVALWCLAVCLVLGPSLGRMHQVVHGRLAHAAGVLQSAHGEPAHSHATHGTHGTVVVQALFNGHAGSDCQLLDQLLFGGALLPAPLPVAALSTAPAPQTQPSAGIDARPQRAFSARAPPASASA
ncbi:MULTISPECIES: hypothetical protein [unclassified Acidovorax]|uniref:hypothetical protein n=1 Tax=unclassified Acidovorax TaxID=2684926 RepID=UPI0028834FE8|nr:MULTISPECIES: hypothetical protein [unclassified Acidovorax]